MYRARTIKKSRKLLISLSSQIMRRESPKMLSLLNLFKMKNHSSSNLMRLIKKLSVHINRMTSYWQSRLKLCSNKFISQVSLQVYREHWRLSKKQILNSARLCMVKLSETSDKIDKILVHTTKTSSSSNIIYFQ